MDKAHKRHQYYMMHRNRANEVRAAYRAANKAFALEFFGNICVQCGSTNELQFDHIDRATVSFRIATAAGLSKSRENLIKELVKCQLLCKSCHIEKTRVEMRGRRKEVVHGTEVGYGYWRCRCEDCKEAKSIYRRSWLAGVSHG